MDHPVVKEIRFFMAHTPGLVRHGSKPTREIEANPSVWEDIRSSLRTFQDATTYAPHQVMLGNRAPDALGNMAAPWYENPLEEALTHGPHGEMVNEDQFYGLLKAADDFDLVMLEGRVCGAGSRQPAGSSPRDRRRVGAHKGRANVARRRAARVTLRRHSPGDNHRRYDRAGANGLRR